MGSQGSNVSSGGKHRLIRQLLVCARADLNLPCTHMPTCTLYWIPADIIVQQEAKIL